MTPTSKDPEVDPVYLLTMLVRLEEKMMPIITAVEKLEETNEGTLRTKGIKEKIATAQQDIEANKLAYSKLNDVIKEMDSKISRIEVNIQEHLRVFTTDLLKKMDEKLVPLSTDNSANKTALQKIQPWINGLAWFATLVGGILVSMWLTGKLTYLP
jgi:septal ring factor EnvC (AmiA/AmiB activator)